MNGPRKIIWTAVPLALLLAGIFVYMRLGGHPENKKHPVLLKNSSRISIDQFPHALEDSKRKTDEAIQLLNEGRVPEAIDLLIEAINLCPINSIAYYCLAKTYLSTGAEMEMFNVLDRAGDSYANFNEIIQGVDDASLDLFPIKEPPDPIYLADFPDHKQMAISFMFDDGEQNVYDHLPVLEKYGFKATISVIAGFVGTSSHWGSWKEWKDASDRGFEIANHSMYHRDLSRLSDAELNLSIEQADALIEKNIGKEVNAFVFPGGNSNSEAMAHVLRVDEVVRLPEFLHAVYNRSVGIVYGGPFFSLETANRLVDIGLKRRLWIIAKAHGISSKPSPVSYKPLDPDLLDHHLAYIHDRLKAIDVDTLTHVYEYMNAKAHTKVKIARISSNAADFTLIGSVAAKALTQPLTVVLKAVFGPDTLAQTSGGQALKAWPCAQGRICVNVPVYDENIHVQFKADAPA